MFHHRVCPVRSTVSARSLPPSMATAIVRSLHRSRDAQERVARQLSHIINQQERIMDGLQAITLAVNNAVETIQSTVDELAAHAADNDDVELNALASRLQGAVTALSTAATRHGQEPPVTGTAGGDTITGAGGVPTSTTNDTVQGGGANDLVQGGAPSFGSGAPAQGDQTGVDVSGNDTVTGGAASTRRRP